MQLKYLPFFIIGLLPAALQAQVKKAMPPTVGKVAIKPKTADSTIRNFKAFPYWIAMMDDPHVTYAQAKLAFEIFWEGRELPEETAGEAANLYPEVVTHGKDEEVKPDLPEGPKFKNPETYQYIYAYKRMKWWLRENADWVNPKTGEVYSQEDKKRMLIKRRNKR